MSRPELPCPMSLVEQILAHHFPGERWAITSPPAGLQKEAYVAQSHRQKLFVKLDSGGPAWPRLAAIGATPPLLAMGAFAGRPYLIQAFAEGRQPDRRWFRQHLPLLARFIRRYHEDRHLQALLDGPQTTSYATHVAQELLALEEALATAPAALFATNRFRRAFARFREQAGQRQPAPLQAVHPDPSPANILVTEQSLTMLDWDGVLLSDPLRDVSLVAWWYLPPALWPRFFTLCATPLDRDGLFWWVARRSLEVALWFAGRQAAAPARAFVDDFYRAVGHEDNPQVGGG